MITFEQLNAQNDRITELTNVLSTLLTDRSLCDSSITCDLFYQYVDEVKKHLEITDRKLYTPLLTSGDSHAMTVANRFMGGSKEIATRNTSRSRWPISTNSPRPPTRCSAWCWTASRTRWNTSIRCCARCAATACALPDTPPILR